MNQVTMRHPDLDGEITVPESAVPIHMASGWAPVAPEPTKPATSTPKATAKDKE